MGNEERTQTCVFIDVSADDFFFCFSFSFSLRVCVRGVEMYHQRFGRAGCTCGLQTQLQLAHAELDQVRLRHTAHLRDLRTELDKAHAITATAEARTEKLQMELQQARAELVELEQENAVPTASARPDFDQMCQYAQNLSGLREKLSEARDQANFKASEYARYVFSVSRGRT